MRTPPEQFWYDILSNAKIEFKEQVSVGQYVADFIIGNIDLEIDGLCHRFSKKHIDHDKKRDLYFEGLGYKVIRVPVNWHNRNKKKQKELTKNQIEYVLHFLENN